jgi:predicted dehydrogenase
MPDAVAGGGMDGTRVGIVGAGWIAQEHHRTLGSIEGADVVAVCDVDVARAEALTGGTGARAYADWREMLDREDLAALLVCTPPMAHREPTVAALSRGLPV